MTLAVTCSERHNKVIFVFMVLFDAFDCTFCIFTNIRVSQTGPLPYMAFLGMLVFFVVALFILLHIAASQLLAGHQGGLSGLAWSHQVSCERTEMAQGNDQSEGA